VAEDEATNEGSNRTTCAPAEGSDRAASAPDAWREAPSARACIFVPRFVDVGGELAVVVARPSPKPELIRFIAAGTQGGREKR
jgi:hypothetical protein